MKLHQTEWQKAIFVQQGDFVTLRQYSQNPNILSLQGRPQDFQVLDPGDIKELVINRYKDEKRDIRLNIIGRGSYTIDELINEINHDSEVGELVVRNELDWISYIVRLLKGGQLEG